MAVDLEVFFDHHLTPTEILDLPYILDPTTAPELADAVDEYLSPDWTRSRRWKFRALKEKCIVWDDGFKLDITKPKDLDSVWAKAHIISVYGPWLSLHVGRVSCALDFTEWKGWHKFHEDEAFHHAVRAVCRELSYIVRSAKAIYLADSVPESLHGVIVGLSTDALIAGIKAKYPNFQLDIEYFDKRPA